MTDNEETKEGRLPHHLSRMKLFKAIAVAAVISTAFVSTSPAYARCRVDGVSKPSQRNAQFTVTNNRNRAANLVWIAFDGSRELYASIGSGETFTQPTYTNHLWLIKEKGTGRCLTLIRLGTTSQQLTIR